MDKKLLSGAIASAMALSVAAPSEAGPKPNAREGLDNPLQDPSCTHDEYDFTASWYDPNTAEEQGTKYGGDIEFDATLFAVCDFEETEAEGTEAATEASFSLQESALIDFDLSKDESDPFHYTCDAEEDAAVCAASVSWEDVQGGVDDAAEAKFGSAAAECTAEVEDCQEYQQVCETVYSCLSESDELIQEEGTWICENGGEPYPAEGNEVCEFTEVCVEPGTKTVAGNFEVFGEFNEDSGWFSVKEMNPGRGKGRQNYEKVDAQCVAEATPP